MVRLQLLGQAEIVLGPKHGWIAMCNSGFGHLMVIFILESFFLVGVWCRRWPFGVGVNRDCLVCKKWLVGDGSKRHDFQWVIGAGVGVASVSSLIFCRIWSWC